MSVKLAVVLLALVAVSQAVVVINTWADVNCNTTIVAKFMTSNNYECLKKRSVAQDSINCRGIKGFPELYFEVDYSLCNSQDAPSFPDGWQYVRAVAGDTTCNFTAAFTAVGAPQSLTEQFILTSSDMGLLAASTNLSCANTGILSFSSCAEIEGSTVCTVFDSLRNGICTPDSEGASSASQSSCIAVPASEPVAAPTTAAPTTAPVSGPVATPTKVPSRASDAPCLMFGSAAFLSALALL